MYNDKDQILELLDTLETSNIKNLVDKVVEKKGKDKKTVRNVIFKMIDENDISIKNPQKYNSFKNFLTDIESLWFWLIVFSLITYYTITIFSATITEIVFFRYILGGVLTLFIPGYATLKALYLTSKNEHVEQAALSIAVSLVITPVTSFILNYTPWGITLTSISISISILSLTLSIIGLYRRYKEQ